MRGINDDVVNYEYVVDWLNIVSYVHRRTGLLFLGGGGGEQRGYCPTLREPNLTRLRHGWRRARKCLNI